MREQLHGNQPWEKGCQKGGGGGGGGGGLILILYGLGYRWFCSLRIGGKNEV